MKKHLVLMLVALLLGLPGLSAQAAETVVFIGPSDEWVALRETPSLQAPIVAVTEKGAVFSVLERTEDGWCFVQTGELRGYIAASLLAPVSVEPEKSGSDESAAGQTMALYRALLRNEGSFFSVDSQQPFTLEQWAASCTDFAMEYACFTTADLDQDQVPELIIEERAAGVSYGYGYLVLHMQDGAILGYEMPYRALMELKTDGTFSFSSGAADNGFGRAAFSLAEWKIVPAAESRSGMDENGEFSPAYFLNASPASQQEFEKALAGQDQKSAAVWHEMTSFNIQNLFPAS